MRPIKFILNFFFVILNAILEFLIERPIIILSLIFILGINSLSLLPQNVIND